uniref:Uncharacterized protein n=1 Tax=Physcomitrium patens TaxID=3218 RepID=A0A2K1J478_PHYPA|nr:hypothetical protein PHYPA_022188 [Physcomitrium patens]
MFALNMFGRLWSWCLQQFLWRRCRRRGAESKFSCKPMRRVFVQLNCVYWPVVCSLGLFKKSKIHQREKLLQSRLAKLHGP